MKFSRRQLLKAAPAALLPLPLHAAAPGDLIRSLEIQKVWNGGETAKSLGWFHPRACLIPAADGSLTRVLMTMQDISGSDVFHHVHVTISDDQGRTWSKPEPISDLDWHALGGGLFEGVCDVVPQWHPQTRTVLAMGHTVFYRNDALTKKAEDRAMVYAVRGPDGTWGKRRKVVWNDLRGTGIYTCGCGERLLFDNGDLLVPVSYGPKDKTDRMVSSWRCAFDGETVTIKEQGTELQNKAGRGLLEPSVTKFHGRYFMTIRAEDGKGHVTTSDDGLHWAETRPWTFDDGEVLKMNTTQTHWLNHSEGLHLVYNRGTSANAKVMRFRAPLYVAAVDAQTLRLRRDTERVVFPLKGDPVNDPKRVVLTDNFHTTAISPDESWVTVGENTLAARIKGDLMIARVKWSRPNGQL